MLTSCCLSISIRLNGKDSQIDFHYTSVSDLCLSYTEPRYASLPNIMKAKKKPIEKLSSADLGVDIAPRFETLSVTEPPKRVGGMRVANVDELVAKLREAGI